MSDLGEVSGDPTTAAMPPVTSRPLLQKILLYGMSRGTTEGLLGVRGLVLASLLGPTAFGAWSLFRLSMRYAAFAVLGVHRGLEVEVVQARADPQGADMEREESASRTTLGFSLAVLGALGVLAIAASFAVTEPQVALGMRAFAAALILEQTWVYSVVLLRARGDLRGFATAEMLNAALHLVSTAALAFLFGLPGALAGFVIAAAVSAALVVRRVRSRPALDVRRLRRLLRIGFPIVLTMLIGTLLATADRLVVAAYGGTTMLGLYTFAVAVAGLAGSAAWVIRTVVFPGVYAGAQGAGTVTAVRSHVERTILPFARLFPPLLGALAIVLGPPVAMLLPQYVAAIEPARIFIFTGVTLGFTNIGAVGVVAAERQRMLPPFSAAALALNVTLSVLVLRSGLGLPGVAAAALLSQSAYSAVVLYINADVAGLPNRARFLFDALIPLMWCAAAVAVVSRTLPVTDISSTVVSLAVFLLLITPLSPAFVREIRKIRFLRALGLER